jgi:hypothetical protein
MRAFAVSVRAMWDRAGVPLRAIAYDAAGLAQRRLKRAEGLRARAAKLIHDAESIEALAASGAPPKPGE